MGRVRIMPRSPISWIGGKYVLAKKIIAHFPGHVRMYTELCKW